MFTKHNIVTNFNFLVCVLSIFLGLLCDSSVLRFYCGRTVLVGVTLGDAVVSSDALCTFIFRGLVSSSIGVGWIFLVSSEGDWVVSSTSWSKSSGVNVGLLDILNDFFATIASLTWVVNGRTSSLMCESTTIFTTVFTSSMISLRMSFNKSLTVDFQRYIGDGFPISITFDLYWPPLPLPLPLSLPPRQPLPDFNNE